MMQGDSYNLEVEILSPDKTVLTPEDLADVEIVIGSIRKRYSEGDVWYDNEKEKWLVHLTQEETFGLPAARIKAQVRVVWPDGNVEGASLGEIQNHESLSKEVL